MDWQELASSQRLNEMMSAINLLDRWLKSTYQLPTLENPSAFNQEKERISALLVDNHLGKLARKVRVLGHKSGLDSFSFLDEWAEITFFTLLWLGFEGLPDGLKSNLIYQSGANITKKHLSQEKSFQDHFLVVGQEVAIEEQLLRRSVYFFGKSTARFYMLIEYSFNQRPFEVIYCTGDVYGGLVAQYPFPGSLRISPQSWDKVLSDGLPFDGMKPLTIRRVVESYKKLLKVNPFCNLFPVVIEVNSCRKNGEWLVRDMEGYKIRMAAMDENLAATFYSATYQRRVMIFALCSRKGLFPLSYFNGEYLVAFV